MGGHGEAKSTVWHDAVRYDAVRHDTLPYLRVLHDNIRHGTLLTRYGAVRCGATRLEFRKLDEQAQGSGLRGCYRRGSRTSRKGCRFSRCRGFPISRRYHVVGYSSLKDYQAELRAPRLVHSWATTDEFQRPMLPPSPAFPSQGVPGFDFLLRGARNARV